ncbi:hypothetical protein [Natronoflexus pectinivorans]|nr:hypothetical protein [Natronoflexus pectinivorans]
MKRSGTGEEPANINPQENIKLCRHRWQMLIELDVSLRNGTL